MAHYGKVSIDEINLFQGEIQSVEKRLLFIGTAPNNQNTWHFVNAQTNFDTLLGSATSNLKTQLLAARANGGNTWCAYVVPKAAETVWLAALLDAMNLLDAYVDFEGLVLCDPATTTEEIENVGGGITSYLEAAGVFPFALVALPGIDPLTQTWDVYQNAMAALVDGIADKHLVPVPLIHGNNIGVLAGRLCRDDVSVADSPMRTATGSVVGLGAVPVDSDDKSLTFFNLMVLSDMRLSVPQQYVGYPGTYWADACTLDVDGSDFAVLENVRVVRKAQRAVRKKLIQKVADRKLNNTPASIASNKNFFMQPLREMARGFVFNGVTFPGDIKPPGDDAIEIIWNSHTQVDVWLKVTPYECPKDLRAHIALDLTLGSAALG